MAARAFFNATSDMADGDSDKKELSLGVRGSRVTPACSIGWLCGPHHLFDLENDPGEDENLISTRVQRETYDLPSYALFAVEAPDDQYEELGIR